MTNLSGNIAGASPQQSIRAKCFHPSNSFVEFKKQEIEQSIPDRFEQQVRRYLHRLAVKTQSDTIIYDVLNRCANRVAGSILAKHEGGEEPVALLFEHGAAAIVSILSVLKAGKIFVPLEPSFPEARLTSMLEDSQARVIVTSNQNLSLANKLASNKLPLINLDKLDSSLPGENVGLSLPPDTLACILYTSGSTGQPKGVVHNHRNLLHFTMNYTNSLHISSDDRSLLLSNYSHLAGVSDILRALLNGAAVFPFNLRDEGFTNLAAWLIQEEITIYHSVPSAFRYLMDSHSGKKEFPKLRLIHLGGEPVSSLDVDLYKKHFSSSCILLNNLSSTETSSYRQYFISKRTQITNNTIPVGYSVENMEILLHDDAGKEVGINCIGEIAVKSRYLSQGYWRKPDLTQATFLPVPGGKGERIYRTGDLGRMLSDGCLVHLGRKDSQVKIRGYRTETAEIEMALLKLASVKEAVVVGRENLAGDKQLVAYIISNQEHPATISELRKFLKEKLPDFMIPSAFVPLESLPLTPNGKVDRRALPAPDQARPELEGAFVAPRTPTEEVLAGIWSDLLGVEWVGIHDNFFDLGGNSLLTTKVVARLERRLGLRINARELVYQTLGQLASACEERMHDVQQRESVSLIHKLLTAIKSAVSYRTEDRT